MPERPAFEDIKKWRTERQNLFGALHTEMGIDEIFMTGSSVWHDTRMEAYLHGLPKEHLSVIPPIGRNGLTVVRNQVMVGETPTVKVLLPESRIDPVKRTKQRETLERKFQALLWHIDTYSVAPPLLTFMDHCLGLGRGILSYPVNYARWQDEPFLLRNGKRRKNLDAKERVQLDRWERQRAHSLPWDVRPINPRKCLWDPYNDPPEDVILEEQVSVRTIAARYPHLRDSGTDFTSDKMGTLVTYCSADFYGVWLDDEPLLKAKNGANEDGVAENTSGIMWYEFADSGFGQETFEGEWQFRVKGIIRDIRPIIAEYIVALNQVMTLRGVNAFPPMDIGGPTQEEADEAAANFKYGPASKFAHGPGITAQPMQLPNVPQAAYQVIEQSEKLLENWFGPRILSGQYDADPTDAQHARRLNQARGPMKPASQGGQQAVAAMLMNMAFQVKHDITGPITMVNANKGIETLSPEDVIDGMRLWVDFTPPSKDEMEKDASDMRQRLGLDLVSRHRVMEADPEIDDVDDEQSTINAEKLAQSDPMQQVLAESGAYQLRQELEAKGLLPPAPPTAPEAPPAPSMEGMAPEMPPPGPEQMPSMPPPGPMAPTPSLNGAGSPLGAIPMGPGGGF